MQESVFEILGDAVKANRDPQKDQTQESKGQNGPQTFSMVLPEGGTTPKLQSAGTAGCNFSDNKKDALHLNSFYS